jgi:hypothetical protein
LAGAAAALAGSAERVAALVSGGALVARHSLARRMADCVAADRWLTHLGQCYLRESGPTNAQQLTDAIAGCWPGGNADLTGLGRASLRQALAAIAREDLRRADVTVVDGWVLARCEARLYAIAALIQGQA